MCCYLHTKEYGFILNSVLLVLAIISFMLLRAFELNLMQDRLLQLFQHKTTLLQQAETQLNTIALELAKRDINSGVNYHIQFDHQDACLNRYYEIESWAKDAFLAAHIKALFIKVPAIQLPNCDYKFGNKLRVEEIF